MKKIIETILMVVLFAVYTYILIDIVNIQSFADLFNAEYLRVQVMQYGMYAPIVFVILYMLGIIFIVPGSSLTFVGVLLFGPWIGFLLSWFAASIASLIAFGFASTVGYPLLSKRFQSKKMYQDLQQGIAKNGAIYLWFMSMSSLVPTVWRNYFTGIIGFEFRKYWWINSLGILPMTLLSAFIADALIRQANLWIIGTLSVFFIGLTVAGMIYLRKYAK